MALSKVLIDVSPLRQNRDFRRLWLGFLVTTIGNELTIVAISYQVYLLTRSVFDVGLVSLVQLGPLFLGAIGGGAIADTFNRRRLLMVTQCLLALTSLALALNAHSRHPALWPIFAASAAAAAISGVDNPTRASLVTDVVGRETLVSASALWQVLYQVGAVAGPALGGLLLAHVGITPVYLVDAGTFAAALLGLARMSSSARPARRPGGLSPRALVGGLRYLRRNQVLQGATVIDLNAMIFGMPTALFPALALLRFHGGPGTLGLLYAAPGIGALIGALLTGWATQVRRQGRAVCVAVGVWGLAITGFGFSGILLLALVMLGVAGAADVISAVFRSAIIQQEAPEELRGRLQAVQYAVVSGGPRLGNLESGAVTAAFGTPTTLFGAEFSAVSGGLACLVGLAVIAKALPRFVAYVPERKVRVEEHPLGGEGDPPEVRLCDEDVEG